MNLTRSQLAAMIDHTLLKPEATPEQIDRLCDEAISCGAAAACVNPLYAAQVARRVAGSAVRACSVVGFPLGATPGVNKAEEARRAIGEGAVEIDTVVPLGLVLAGDWDRVQSDLALTQEVCAAGRAGLKVIFESAALQDEQIIRLCRICRTLGTAFVKTSTGFHASGGASEHAVRLMHEHFAGPVKASGGIRNLASAQAMLAAGATRLGLSATLAILNELPG